ncbi:MAG: hypothetical protein KGY57_06625 [Gammaproteobacteria bacterium]|nr:hypothetical protein [Gammaproteobacteria bacterium]
MRRIIRTISFIAIGLCSSIVSAQGDSPLIVDVPLPGLQRLVDPNPEITIEPLSADVGVADRWQATLGQNSAGAAVIEIKSTQDAPVLPAALRLVVDWSRGRMQQDYRLALNGSNLQAEPLSLLRFGPTDARMNLYRLADLLRSESISINQMMLRLLADNPNAFAIEHVNALEVNRYLQVPPVGASGYISVERADQIVTQQLSEWDSLAAGLDESLPMIVGAQANVEQRDRLRQQLAEDNHRLGERISALQKEVLALTQANREPVTMPGSAVQEAPAEPANPFDNWRALGIIAAGLAVILLWFRRRRQDRRNALRETPVQSDPVLAEANAQVRNGQLDAAQETLDIALGQAPERIDWRLRLLEILADRDDAIGFESEAYVLHAQLDDKNDPRWQEVARRGRKLLPEHALFADD